MLSSPRLRCALVFAVTFTIFAIVSGRALWRPSANNHYVHMATGWLDHRVDLAGRPPHGNDWGRITTVKTKDGQTFQGHPCRTSSCRQRARLGFETWLTLDGKVVEVRRNQVLARHHRWTVTFPPGPAVVFLPFAAIAGLNVWDALLTAIAAALGTAILVWFLDRERPAARPDEHLWVAAAWALASPACFVAANGSVWFSAQIFAAMFVLAYLGCGWNLRHPALAGLWLGMAVACRPPLLLAAAWVLGEWWRTSRSPRTLALILTPLFAIIVALGWFNWMRFGDPTEFGHRFLDIRWQARIQEDGLFSTRYVGRNLHAMLLLLPQIHHGTLRWSIHGMSLLVSTPWLFCAFAARQRFPQRPWLWVTAALVALPGLAYQNTGQVQFTYRFALDWLPFALVALVMGGGTHSRWFRPLVAAGAAIGLYGAWMFAHAPQRLFLPTLWPYGE